MTALIIILAILLIIALLRIGVYVSYSDSGVILDAVIGPFKIHFLPKEEKKQKKTKEKTAKTKPTKSQPAKKDKKGGVAKLVFDLLPGIGSALGKFRRKLRIDTLTVYFTSAAADPCDAAMNFGYVSAGFGTLCAFIRRFFKVKKLDLQSFVNFDTDKPLVFIEAQFTLAIWEIISIAGGFGLFFIKIYKNANNENSTQPQNSVERNGSKNG